MLAYVEDFFGLRAWGEHASCRPLVRALLASFPPAAAPQARPLFAFAFDVPVLALPPLPRPQEPQPPRKPG